MHYFQPRSVRKKWQGPSNEENTPLELIPRRKRKKASNLRYVKFAFAEAVFDRLEGVERWQR